MAARRAYKLVEKSAPSLRRAVYTPIRNAGKEQRLVQAVGPCTTPAEGSRSFTSIRIFERQPQKCTSHSRQSIQTLGRPAQSIYKGRTFSAAADLPVHEEIGMPSLSPTMQQGNIAKWVKQVGDQVVAGDVLCEIETDKATLEMESMEDGYIARILHGDGAKDLPVGTPIAILVESKDDIEKFADYTPGEASAPPSPKAKEPEAAPAPPPPPPKKEEAPKPAAEASPPPPPSPPKAEGRIFATPAAKKLAEDNKVDLSQVQGTGPDGRIVKADIEEFVAKGPAPSAAPAAGAPSGGAAAAPLEGVGYTDIPNSQIRKSKQTVPHFYLSVDAKVDKLLALRAELNAIQEKNGGKRLSLNDFVVKAAAIANRKVPECNSSWTEDFIRRYDSVDVSIAVQTERGLMVPVVKNADKKGLAEISEEIKSLADKAKAGKLKPDEYEGGTFTVSNLGMFGVKSFSAIINPPQACILAVGGTEKVVVPGAILGEFGTANVMSVTLSCDHRVVDGAVGAQWVGQFKSLIEDPVTLLL
eukprot:jgi/Mesen1/8794/ME000528S08182